MSWLNDGVHDCVSGKDELDIWPTCQFLDHYRQVIDNTTCRNVFICKQGSLDFVELPQLCDGVEECGEERSVCYSARSRTPIITSALSFQNRLHFFYCIPGMSSMENLANSCVERLFRDPDYPIFGMNASVSLKLPNVTVNCVYIFGELLVYLSCIGVCGDMTCPLTSLQHESCSKNNIDKIYTLSHNKHLTFVSKKEGGYKRGMFKCANNYCVTFEKVCNLVNDCGDNSDESNCTNHFRCPLTNLYITRDRKCDGTIDCFDRSDECNEECGKDIISGVALKGMAWLIGGTAVSLNLLILWQVFAKSWSTCANLQINSILKVMINIGDMLTGSYLLLIAIADQVVLSERYCEDNLLWLSSSYCALLGIMSTTGATISLFSMTLLSVSRAGTLANRADRLVGRYSKQKITLIILVMTSLSLALALIPLIDRFEDFFVNGMTYGKDIRLFFSAAKKDTHLDVLKAYYGKISKTYLSWKEIQKLVIPMFTSNYGGIGRRKIHFYGNGGVCLFKYFVKSNDPQLLFVWVNLAIDFICFVVISGCYVFIVMQARKRPTTKFVTRDDHQGTARLDANVTGIIITDLLCWTPFILACALHTFEVTDATFLYPFFSIVVLPINSVINPILYHDYLRNKIHQTVQLFKLKLQEVTSSLFTVDDVHHPQFEMRVVDVREGDVLRATVGKARLNLTETI